MDEKYPLALPAGTVLAGQYIIEKVLGQGGFGITYEARDHKNGDRIAVKEFFPDTMATRNGTTVMPYTGERGESFTYGKECFLQEAETLAQFIGNENIVRIHSYFEEYGTAYFVMDFVEGTSFDAYIKAHDGRLSFDETAKILLPVMDALGAVHSKGVIHRDVTPDNIYITKDGVVKLLDFGAARYSLGDKSRSLDVILKHGFAPKEQYTRRGRQGPYTDIYALGATFYFALTGRRPPDSVERMDEDDLIPPSTLGVKISAEAEAAILKALSVQPADRFQNMAEFKNAMLAAAGATVSVSSAGQAFVPQMADNGTVIPQRFFGAPATDVVPAVSIAHEPVPVNVSVDETPVAPSTVTPVIATSDISDTSGPIYTRTQNETSENSVGSTSSTPLSRSGVGEQSLEVKPEKKSKLSPALIAIAAVVIVAVIALVGTVNKADPASKELYPVIKGNLANNLLNLSDIAMDGNVFRDEQLGREYCLSQIGDTRYGIAGDSKTAVINGSTEIPELSRYSGKMRALLVSDEYYFAYTKDGDEGILHCVDRGNGSVVGERSFEDNQFTFVDAGYLVFLEGSDGNQRISYVPAGDISARHSTVKTFCSLPVDQENSFSGAFYSYIYYGGGSTIYVGGQADEGKCVVGKYDLNDSGTYTFTSFASKTRTFALAGAYGERVYLYYYINSNGKTQDFSIDYYDYGSGGNPTTVYDCPDDAEYYWGFTVFNNGSRIGMTAYPYVVGLNPDGTDIRIVDF